MPPVTRALHRPASLPDAQQWFAARGWEPLGGGFTADAMFEELRSAPAYAALARDEFAWALRFVTPGGASLHAYPEYHRVVQIDGVYRVRDRGIAQRHRLQVGTIVGDACMQVKWLSGGTLGSIEEGFIARLSKGDHFVFAGRVLEYVRTQDMTAYVRRCSGRRSIVPAWSCSKMPLSGELADTLQECIHAARRGEFNGPEMLSAMPMLKAQARLSALPAPGTLLDRLARILQDAQSELDAPPPKRRRSGSPA